MYNANRQIWALTAAVSLLLLTGAVHALPCIQGSVSSSVACQDGANNNNNDDVTIPLDVNTEVFHGFSDWVYLEKQNAGGALETNIDVDWEVDPTVSWASATGTWSFNSTVWSTYEDVMIVVKSGNDGGVFFSGYLLDNGIQATSGTWDTGDKTVSHLTLYARGDTPMGGTIPEPATLGLVALGFLGAGRRRKRSVT